MNTSGSAAESLDLSQSLGSNPKFLSSALKACQIGLSMILNTQSDDIDQTTLVSSSSSSSASPSSALHLIPQSLLMCPMCGRTGFGSEEEVSLHWTFEHYYFTGESEQVEEETKEVIVRDPLPKLSNDILSLVVPFCDFETIESMVHIDIPSAQSLLDYLFEPPYCCGFWEDENIVPDESIWIKDECVATWLLMDCHHHSPEVSLPRDPNSKIQKQSQSESTLREKKNQWKKDLFMNICGPPRGLYCFMRHILRMSGDEILNMTTREVLIKMSTLDGISVDMATMMAAQFYGLNNLACVLFEAMDLSGEEFLSEWELLLVLGNRYFLENCPLAHLWQNVFSMIDGRDPLASMFVHGNKYLVRQIWSRYGDENGVVWCDGVSIFTRSMPLAFDTLSLIQDWAPLGRNWRFHLCNHPRGVFELCHIFVRATNPSSFHMWYQIYRMTGSPYALSRVRERADEKTGSKFGLAHLRLLSRNVLNLAKLEDFLKLCGQCGFLRDSDLRRQFIAAAEKYPFDQIGCHNSEKYHYTAVKRYLTKDYMELHSAIHTLVFRV